MTCVDVFAWGNSNCIVDHGSDECPCVCSDPGVLLLVQEGEWMGTHGEAEAWIWGVMTVGRPSWAASWSPAAASTQKMMDPPAGKRHYHRDLCCKRPQCPYYIQVQLSMGQSDLWLSPYPSLFHLLPVSLCLYMWVGWRKALKCIYKKKEAPPQSAMHIWAAWRARQAFYGDTPPRLVLNWKPHFHTPSELLYRQWSQANSQSRGVVWEIW